MQRAHATRAGQLLATRLPFPAAISLGTSRVPSTRAAHSLTAASQANAWCAVSIALHTSLRFASSSSAPSAAHAASRSHYRCLGIDTDATPQEVKAAYRQLALRYHPDVAADEHRAQSEFLFRRVSEAYEVLSDPVKRRAHDNELGVQTRRKQATATTTAGSAASSSSSSSSSSSQTRGTAAHAARKKRRTASTATTSSQQQQQNGKRYRTPFVRGDANRVFADAFDGKTLDEILFDVQRRRRQATKTTGTASTAPASSADDLSAGALDREARLRHVMEDAAESFAAKAQRQYGHGILRHIRATASPLPVGPSPPPDAYMPFRPFVGTEVPAGVRTPPEPQQGPVLSPQEATIEPAQEDDRSANAVPGHFHTHRYADGVLHSRMGSLDKATKNVGGMAHNMGQLYSYQRPY